MDLAGVALLITAIAALITAISTARRAATVGSQVLEKVVQIDHAVNGKEPGDETMGDQVQTATAVLPLVRQIAVDVKDLKPGD